MSTNIKRRLSTEVSDKSTGVVLYYLVGKMVYLYPTILVVITESEGVAAIATSLRTNS